MDASLPLVLSRARQGEREAHEELFRRYEKLVYTVARRILPSVEEASEFLEAVLQSPSLRKGPISAREAAAIFHMEDRVAGLDQVLNDVSKNQNEHLEVLKAGDTVHLNSLRDGNTREVDLKLRKSEGNTKIKMLFLGDDGEELDLPDFKNSFSFLTKNDLDLELASLNKGLAEYFGTSEGILVLDISQENSLGLKAGDVIQRIGDREVRGPEHAFRIFRSYEPDEAMKLEIIRHGKSLELEGAKK